MTCTDDKFDAAADFSLPATLDDRVLAGVAECASRLKLNFEQSVLYSTKGLQGVLFPA